MNKKSSRRVTSRKTYHHSSPRFRDHRRRTQELSPISHRTESAVGYSSRFRPHSTAIRHAEVSLITPHRLPPFRHLVHRRMQEHNATKMQLASSEWLLLDETRSCTAVRTHKCSPCLSPPDAGALSTPLNLLLISSRRRPRPPEHRNAMLSRSEQRSSRCSATS